MTPLRRVLIVAYYFPPIGGIGSIRLARFASLLPEHGWEPTVLAPRDTPHATDPNLRFPEEHVIRSRSIEFSKVGRTLTLDSSAPTRDQQSKRRAARAAVRRHLFFPDAQIGWYPGAVAAGRRALRDQTFDAIYSSSYPMTAHLVARTLSRRSGLPWAAESRDPYADRLPQDHPHKRRAARLERSIAREAAAVIMPTPTWAGHYGALWGVHIDVVSNGHDEALPQRTPPQRPTLAHIGTYYPGRHDLTALWEALVRLREDDPGRVPQVRLVGHASPDLDREVARFGLSDVVHATGFLPHDEAMRELMSASMLIASGIAGNDPFTRGWVPAKVFDYIASGLPVLYLSRPDTDAAALFEGRPGCRVVAPDDVDGALAAVEAGLTEAVHERPAEELSRAAGAGALARVLDRMTVASGRSEP